MALSFEEIRGKLAARFGDAVGPTVAAKDPFVVVKGEKILEAARFLKEEPTLALDYLIDATAVDYPKESLLRVVYHLWSMGLRHGFKLKVELARQVPSEGSGQGASVASVSSVWSGANWLEREMFDLFGIHFEGHPDLRRLLMPEDWEGHPLLKDYQAPQSYHGIGHERVTPITTNPERDRRLRAAQAPVAPPTAAPTTPPATPASGEGGSTS
jgi:NADH-quinone oxidoreductase subunit C